MYADDVRKVARWHVENSFYKAARSTRPAAEREFWQSLADISFRIDGQYVAARKAGDGLRKVIFVPGVNGRGGQFARLASRLAVSGHTVVLFDALGHGDSDGEVASSKECLKVLLALDQREGPFHGMVCHSFGSVWALYALYKGMNVDKFLALSPIGRHGYGYQIYQKAHSLSDEEISCLREMVTNIEGPDDSRGQRPEHVVQLLRHKVAALICHAEKDQVVPPEHGRLLSEHWAGSEFFLAPGVGHFKVLESEDVIARAIHFMKR